MTAPLTVEQVAYLSSNPFAHCSFRTAQYLA